MNFESAFKFLKALGKNNNREWFERKKPHYLGIKEEFDQFVAGLLEEFILFDDSLAGLNPKKLAYRIYRDVRFARDKRPYKNNLSAGFSPHGKMADDPGYYLQIQNGDKSFIAGGLWSPDPEKLAKIRQEIDYNSDRFLAILNDRKFKTLYGALEGGDKLKKTPKGYPADHPQAELLKHRSFFVRHRFTDAEVTDRKFMKKVAAAAKVLKPLNDFLTEATA